MSDDNVHTVQVTFRKTLHEYETPEEFVRSAIEGNRASNFATLIAIFEVDG